MQGADGTRRKLSFWGLLGLLLLLSPTVQGNPYLKQLKDREVELQGRLRTPAGVLPLAELLSLWELVPPNDIARLLSIAIGPRSHPLVRGYGRLLAAEVALHQGRHAEAARHRLAAGVVPHWQFCGPLTMQWTDQTQACGSAAERSESTVGPPRKWRALLHSIEGDAVDLSHLYGKGRYGKGRYGKGRYGKGRYGKGRYGKGQGTPKQMVGSFHSEVLILRALVSSAKEQPAALRLSVGSAWQVTVNGRQVAPRSVIVTRSGSGINRGRPAARADQAAVGFWLRAGDNDLQLKVALRKGLRLYARLTTPDGSPLRGIAFPERRDPRRSPLPVPRRAPPPVTLGTWLCDKWAKRQEKPSYLRDVTRYLQRIYPGDPCFPSLEEVVRKRIRLMPSPEVYLILAGLLGDHNQEREALEQARRIKPEDQWALHRFAVYHHENRQVLRALELWRELLRRVPGFFPAALKLADIYRTTGLNELAARALDTQLRLHPQVGRVVLARADHALGQDNLSLARSLYERHLVNNQDELYTRNMLASLALRRGAPREALSHLGLAIQHHPRRVFLRKKRIQILAGVGRLEEALAECKAALMLSPETASLSEELGHLHYRAGRTREAWSAWRRALALTPQNPELRAYLAYLNPRLAKGEVDRHRIDPVAIIAEARKHRRGEDPALVLLDLTATEVLQSGLSRTLRQRLVRVNHEAGVDSLSQYAIKYNPDRQELTIKVAKVHKASGGGSLAREAEISLNEPWARMWYDLRARQLRFIGLAPGDLIEIEYILEDVAPDNLFANYFGDLRYLAEDLPVKLFRYVLITPKERHFNIHHPRGKVRHEVVVKGQQRILSWTARDLAKIVDEPTMPGWSEVSEYIHVSTYARWSQVARWYWELVKRQLSGGPAIIQAARRITRGAVTERQKIRAIHAFVTRNLRYVGLAFGIHGYQPYAANQVLSRKFGDCKDKSTLLIALLSQVGVDSTLVLVRTRRQGRMASTPASLAPFDHAVVYLPKHDLYLDATAEFSGSGELPAQIQGVMALQINEGRGVLRRTPVGSARSNRVIQQDQYVLSVRGPGRLNRTIEIRGTEAARWRRQYQVKEDRLQRYEQALNQSLGGVKILRLEMHGLTRFEQSVRVRVAAQVQGLTRSLTSRSVAIACAGSPSSLTRRWARLSRRRHALVLPHAWSNKRVIELRAPPGWRAAALPAPRTIRTRLGTFKRHLERKGWGVRVTLELEVLHDRIAPADYGDFRRFLLQVDQLQNEEVFFAL